MRLAVLATLVVVALGGLLAVSTARIPPTPAGPTAIPPGADRTATTADGWLRFPNAPVALTEVATAAWPGGIWVVGGLDAQGRASDRVSVFDPAAGTWREGPRLPSPVHHSALLVWDSSLYLLGGYGGLGSSGPTERVLVLGAPDDGWEEAIALPAPRAAGAAGLIDGAPAYAGGVGPDGVSAGVWRLVGGVWVSLPPLGAPREHLAGLSGGDGRFWVLGGRQGGLDTNVATVEAIGMDGPARLPDVPTARGGVAAFWGGDALGACLVGGEGPGGTHPEVECVAPDGTVTALPPLRVARHGLGAVVLDGTAYVVQGGPEPGLFVSDVLEGLALPAG